MKLYSVALAALALTFLKAEPVYQIANTNAPSMEIAQEALKVANARHETILLRYNSGDTVRTLDLPPLDESHLKTEVVPLINNLLGRPLWSE